MPEYWDGYFFVWEVLRSKFENHFGIIKFFSLKISSFHTLLQYNIRPGYGEVRLYNTRTWKKITSIRVSPFNNFFAYSFESRNLLLLRFRLNRINNNTNTSSALSLGNILFCCCCCWGGKIVSVQFPPFECWVRVYSFCFGCTIIYNLINFTTKIIFEQNNLPPEC